MTPPQHGRYPGSNVVVLQTPSGRSRAEVLTDCGFNCARWSFRRDDQTLEILWPGISAIGATSTPDAPAAKVLSPFRFGIPVLFPFPNRICHGVYHWSGREYRLPINDPQQRHAIHGFVADRPWETLAVLPQGEPTGVTGRFRLAREAGDRRAFWPADFTLTLTWQLREPPEPPPRAELSAQVIVASEDTVPLPFGMGFHPYFAVPADDAQVLILSAQRPGAELRRWELHDLIPSGRLLPLRPSDWRLVDDTLTDPLPPWDDAFRIFAADTGEPTVVLLRDCKRRFAIRIEAEPVFRDLVLFVPPHRQAVCVEPYTCVTDAIHLHAQGIASGLRVLQPGERWQTSLTITVLSEL